MEVRLEALVLKAIKYGDKSIVLRCLTRELGLQSYMVNSIRSNRSVITPGLVQPLTYLNLVATHKNKGTLERILEAKVHTHFTSLYQHPVHNAIAQFCVEVLNKVARESIEEGPLFEIAIQFMYRIESGTQVAGIPLDFVKEVCQVLGIEPDLVSEDGSYFDLIEGHLVGSPPFHSTFLSQAETEQFKSYFTHPMASYTRVQRREILRNYLKYMKIHLDSFGEIKSLKVLQVLFD